MVPWLDIYLKETFANSLQLFRFFFMDAMESFVSLKSQGKRVNLGAEEVL